MASSSAHPANRLTALVKDNQLATFVILAYALSWWPWIWYQYDPVAADAPILPLGPFLAALIILALSGGWQAVKEWLAKIVHWRVGWVWYAMALLLPVALTLSAVGINLMMGAERAAAFETPDAGSLAVLFVFIFFFIGLGEEPAWRGFALPRLLNGRSALAAALILGVIHMVWHAPLYGVEYDSANVVPWGITVICVSIVICWMWLHTGGSLLLPMLLHASNNTVALVWRMFEGGDQLRLWWIWSALWVIATAVIAFTTGKDLTRSRNAA
jgi:uncharacterized protein